MNIERIIEGALEANGYVLWQKDGGEAYVIDPGYAASRYTKFAKAHALRPKAILLTHTHHDHAGKAAHLAEAFGCPVMAQREELDYYKGRVDEILEGGERLDLGGEQIDVLHTPGHTAGGLCFYSAKSRVAFTGDTVFNVDIGYTHFAGGSAERMKNSLREVVGKWADGITIHPGHGDPATMKAVREINRDYIDMTSV
ncbi:MAG: MBL fold metallo-hydrolase [Clostridiales Family XIII bacterium]|jgi:glyoxylase-like metal-dependent hydrolase (beta-lactamase superfamily II)|nr:MBL fold metallo-hydrolase [Clostridiales Family XIII bacterium]